jgi:hypothetical protein
MNILKPLLEKGYFPVQLPPGFTSVSFAAEIDHFAAIWDAVPEKKIPLTQTEKFSVARSSYFRRGTAIVNPISFYYLAKEIDNFWPQIEEHFQKSTLSRSNPNFGPSLRAINLPKFSQLYEEKITSSAGFKYALITDVTSFFPAIYTHTIPWALHGKEVAKKNKKKLPTYFGNVLDGRCMGLQDGQTIGLPIGPDTSHILAEIIGVAIDIKLKDGLGDFPQGFRYVDDFFLFFDRREEAEKALAVLTKAINSFELQINPTKTRIIEVKELVEESWKYSLKKLKISAKKRQQRDDIHNYFEVLFSLEKRFQDESLVKYGLKQLSSSIVKKSNWPVMEAYLLKCGYSFPNTIQVIANILATYNHHGYALNKVAITRFCNNLIRTSAISYHHSEVAWLLWICKELELTLSHEITQELESMASPICTLIALDLHDSGLLKDGFTSDFLFQFAQSSILYRAGWLLGYEAGRRNWLNNQDCNYIEENDYFGELLKADVSFYNADIKLPPIFTLKNPERSESLDFDNDDEIEDDFEFDEMDEEYFDSVEHEDDDLFDDEPL